MFSMCLQAEGTPENTELMADYVRRATLLWLDLRSVAAADPPSPEQRRQLEAYNAEHLGFVRKDPDNSVRRVRILILHIPCAWDGAHAALSCKCV